MGALTNESDIFMCDPIYEYFECMRRMVINERLKYQAKGWNFKNCVTSVVFEGNSFFTAMRKLVFM